MIGSFLNALIYRIPRGLNFTTERSKCPHCNNIIKWYMNIPILSYIFLKGKCAFCKKPISLRYPLIELMVGIFALYIFREPYSLYNISYSMIYFSIFCAFVIHFFIDVEHHILPDGVNIYIALVLFLLGMFQFDIKHAILGGAIGFSFPYLVTMFFYYVRKVEGLGGGDIKLFAALGLYLGPIGIIYNILFSCVLGSLFSIPLLLFGKMNRNTALAFGPFILITAFVQIFFAAYFQKLIAMIF